MNSFTNLFGSGPIKPAQVQFEAITLSGSLTLYWPTETQAGQTYVAAQMNVDGSGTLVMPDARQGSSGVASLIVNVGASSFNVTTNTGSLIATLDPGLAWIVSLTDNTTQAGLWQAIQLAATTSNAQAAALAGAGLQAVATQLQVAYPSQTLAANTPIVSSYRANAVIWNGAAGTLTLDTIANLTAGWWCFFTNEGTADVTIATSGGATINGGASYTLPHSTVAGQYYSAVVICTAGGFHVFAAVPNVIQVAHGGTGADNAPDALTNLGGSSIGITIFTAPSAAAVLAALGITGNVITEQTIAVNTAVTSGSSGLAYHCSAALTLSLVANSGLTTSFFFLVDAHGGAVTITPNAADAINGQAAGASYVMAQGSSLIMTTDAAGNWWPFANGGGGSSGIPWAIAAGTADAITGVFSPAIVALTDGLLLSFRALLANATTTPTFKADATTAHTITKEGGIALAKGDIPGVLFEALVRYNLANTRWELLNPASASLGEQAFIANGNFTTPANTLLSTVFEFELAGGGAGGGGGAKSGGATTYCAGSGGGAGGAVRVALSGFAANAVVTIACGAAGAAGDNTGTNGTDGGTTSITYNTVSVASCTGGTKGLGQTSVVTGIAVGGAAGTATVGVGASGLTLLSQNPFVAGHGSNNLFVGYDGASALYLGGEGGSGLFGSGGRAASGISTAGGAATGNGAGGAGGSGTNSGGTTGAAGGVGTIGTVIVRWVI